ncbi:hypothetical protein [Pseudoduganella lurida]|nr:hypothetical protein [Pseudoduganella lurida]
MSREDALNPQPCGGRAWAGPCTDPEVAAALAAAAAGPRDAAAGP